MTASLVGGLEDGVAKEYFGSKNGASGFLIYLLEVKHQHKLIFKPLRVN
jgi:hypothetical protein